MGKCIKMQCASQEEAKARALEKYNHLKKFWNITWRDKEGDDIYWLDGWVLIGEFSTKDKAWYVGYRIWAKENPEHGGVDMRFSDKTDMYVVSY